MADAKVLEHEAKSVPMSPRMSESPDAIDLDQLPNGYYRSKNFIGSLIGVCLMAMSLYLGYTMPVCYPHLSNL